MSLKLAKPSTGRNTCYVVLPVLCSVQEKTPSSSPDFHPGLSALTSSSTGDVWRGKQTPNASSHIDLPQKQRFKNGQTKFFTGLVSSTNASMLHCLSCTQRSLTVGIVGRSRVPVLCPACFSCNIFIFGNLGYSSLAYTAFGLLYMILFRS